MNFHLKRNKINISKNPVKLKDFLKSKGKYLLIREKEYKKIKDKISKYLVNYKLLWKKRLGHRKLMFFTLKQ